MAHLLTSRPAAADTTSATAARAAVLAGASPEATSAALGGVQVTLSPALLEALERFAASIPTSTPADPVSVTAEGASASDRGTALVGDGGTASVGDGGTALVGDGGTASVGDGGTGSVGDGGTGSVGDGGTASVGDGGTASALGTEPTSVDPIGINPEFARTQPLPAVAPAAAPVITNLIRQAQPILASTMEPVQAVITEVAAGLFDRIFAAPDIPDSIKALIGKLQLKIFKALMQDPQILTNPEHPLRQFVDELADIGVKRQQSLAQGDPVFERISTIVDNLYQHFEEDPNSVERARHQLSVFIASEEESAQGIIFDSVVEVQQQEEVELGASMAAFEVDRRFSGKLILRNIKEFVRLHWQALLAKDYLVDGEDGAQWKADLATLDDLLWSISPAETAKDRGRLLKLLPKLLGSLNAGLNRIDVSLETRDPYFQVLVAVHTGLLRPAKVGAPSGDLEGQLEMPTTDPRANLRKRNTTIERGQWIEMKDENGSTQRCRLSWVSPLKETFVFKNYDTKEAITLSAEEFVRRESEGRVKLIEEQSLTERSIEGALRGLLDAPASAGVAAA